MRDWQGRGDNLLTIRKRGKTFHADLMNGNVHVARGSLGTRNQEAARRLIHRLETALSEGQRSAQWSELETLLPTSTYTRFAAFAGVKPVQLPTWDGLKAGFSVFMEQR